MSNDLHLESGSSSKDPKKRKGILSFFLGMSLLVTVVGVVWYFAIIKPAGRMAHSTISQVEKYLGSLLGNRGTVTRNDSSSLLKVSDVGELALMEFETKISKELESEAVALHVLTSKKRLRMEGRFKVKIGYDISQGLAVGYTDTGQAFIEGLGEPKVLSAEMVVIKTVEDASGLWNKVNEQDRDALTNQLRLQAIRDVKESGMLEQMDRLMRQSIRALLGVSDLPTLEASMLP